jgi:hypothetical protein
MRPEAARHEHRTPRTRPLPGGGMVTAESMVATITAASSRSRVLCNTVVP